MNKSSGIWGGALLALVSATTQAQSAEGTASVPSLSAIQVQGHVAEQLPEGSTRISRKELDERVIEDWDDFARRGSAGVNFNRNTDSVNVRGMDQDRVVTRVDGIRLPWLDDGARGERGGLSAIDFRSLSSVDLVRGAGAPASGSLTGYLDLRTLEPDDLLPPGQDLGALFKTGYDTADDSWDGHVALAGRLANQDTKWLFQAGLRRGHELDNRGSIGGYGETREYNNPESNKQHNLLLKLQHDLNAEHRLTLSGESFRLHRDIDNRLEQGPDKDFHIGANSTNEELTRQRVWAGYGFRSRAQQAALEYADFKIYWQESELEGRQDAIRRNKGVGMPDRFGTYLPYGPYGRANSIKERSHGMVGEWGGTLGGEALKHSWSMGAEGYASRSDQHSSGYDNCPAVLPPAPFPRACQFLHTNQADVPSAKGTVYSLWLQDEISWNDGRYAVVPALRYDHYRYRPQTGGDYGVNPNAEVIEVSDNSSGRFSPSMMLKMQAAEDLTLYAKYGYGFKAPNSYQLYMNFGAPGTYLRKGDPNLRPEISRGWELGLDYGNTRRGMQLSVFNNRYRDFIDSVSIARDSADWDPAWDVYPMGVTSYLNRSRVNIYGAELSGQWEFNENWYSWGSVAWTRGKDQDTDEYINSIAPLKAILGLGYRQQQWGVDAVTTLVRRRNEVADPDTDFKAPGFGLLDFSGWWAPAEVKGLRVRAGIYNVFDKKYWNALNIPDGGTRGSAPIDSYTEPGRSFRISLTYQY